VWFGHVGQSAPGSSLPQWSHASRQLPFPLPGSHPGGARPDGSTTGAGCTFEPM
jgi:hypothetical protein